MDMRTVLISYLITNAICAGVIGGLYSQNRKQFKGLELWLAAYIMQFAGLVLIITRGYLPEFISAVVGNGIFIGGTILLYMGVERFLGKRSNQTHNYILLALFVAAHAYFLVVHPSMTARSLNLSLALLALCAQFVWLTFQRADVALRPVVRVAGFVFAAYGAVSLIRIFVNMVTPLNEDFFQLDLFDTVVIMTYQMLFIALTFSLFMMVNRRLQMELREDIAEHKQTEEFLKQSEQLYRQMFTEHSAVKMLIDPSTGSIIQANFAAAQFYGYSVDELQAMKITQVNTLPFASIAETMQKACQRTINYFVFQHRLASGEIRDVEVHSAPIKVGGRELLYSIIHDITERKQVEEALQERTRFTNQLLEATALSTWISDEHGTAIQANPACYQFFGTTEAEVIGKYNVFQDNLAEQQGAMPLIRRAYETGEPVTFFLDYDFGAVSHIKVKNAAHKFIKVMLSPILDTHGKVSNVVSQSIDLTDIKRTEEALRASEASMRSLIENVKDVIVRYDLDLRYQYVSPMIQRFLEATPESFIGKTNREAGFPEGQAEFVDASLRKAIKSKNTVDVEFSLQGRGGEYIMQTRVYPELDEKGEVNSVVTVTRDITERKQTEAALRESRETLALFINQSPIYTYIKEVMPTQSRVIYASENFADMIGIPGSEMVGKTMEELFPADFAAKITADDWAVASGKEISNQEEELNGRQYTTIKFPLLRTGRANLLAGYTIDITERKQAEEKLRASEERFRQLIVSAPDAVFLVDQKGNITFANMEAENLLGYAPEEFVGMDVENLIPQKSREGHIHSRTKFMRGSRTRLMGASLNLMAVHKNGSEIPVDIKLSPVKMDTGTYIVAFVRDITERKQAEEEHNRLARLVDASPASITIHDEDGKFLYANQKTFDLHGYSREEFMTLSLHQLNVPESAQLIAERMRKIATRGEASFEVRHIRQDASTFPLQVNVRTTTWNNKAVFESIAVDITEQKRAEEKLREQGLLLSQSQEIAHIGSWKLNLIANHLTWSDEVYQIFGCEPQEFTATYEAFLNFIHPDDRGIVNEAYSHSLQVGADEYEIEHRIIRPGTGEIRYVRERCVHERDDTGTIIQSIGMVQDITESKHVENELRATHKALQMQFNEINVLKELLQEQAIRDPLTNLHNRRYLDETLGHEVARARRENYPIGIMLIDIDRFKKFNDTYGHSAGDEVLKSLGRLLVDSVRQGDIACRYGGEEFLLVMIGAHETDVERRAEAICRDFSKLRIIFEGQKLSATVSVGIAFYPRHGMDIQQVISSADAAMYQAKEAGRNQVQVWQA